MFAEIGKVEMCPSFLCYQTSVLDNIHTDGLALPSLSHWEDIKSPPSWLNNKGLVKLSSRHHIPSHLAWMVHSTHWGEQNILKREREWPNFQQITFRIRASIWTSRSSVKKISSVLRSTDCTNSPQVCLALSRLDCPLTVFPSCKD